MIFLFDMKTKKCFKCGSIKPIGLFYKHGQMGDGYLNKCKDCTKNDVHNKYVENKRNPEYMLKERVRGREKYHRLGYRHNKPSIHNKVNASILKNLSRFLTAMGYNLSEREAHHWNYNFAKSGFLLRLDTHKLIHSKLVFDENSQCFSYDGNMLDTKEVHRAIIEQILKENDIVEHIVEFDF